MMNSSEIMSVMQLLGWKDVSTKRQRKNGTQIFELPIKVGRGNTNIKVGSFQSGYVRRMNHCYTPYQLNKCKPSTEYWKSYKWVNDKQVWDGKYTKYVGKQRIVIPDEVDRLNYLISYCLKNFYIGYANQVANGKFIPKWEHEYEMKNGSLDKVRELQMELQKKEKEFNSVRDVSITIDGTRYKVM